MILAFDRSMRTYGKDGHLHVELSHISKANVCPYRGSEIPGCKELGLDPDRVYQLLRDPAELEKGAPTFNNLPILSRHVPVSSAAHPKELVIGSTGTDAVFDGEFLDNSLVFWTDEAIAGIETKEQRELSSAYHYVADMTPGTYKGLRYDGIMRNIVGNHVALVDQGRAGPDVIVGDRKISESSIMAKGLTSRKALMVSGALAAFVKPILAMDAKVDFAPALKGVTAKNFKERKPAIAAAVTRAVSGKLAADAQLGDVIELLDAMEDVTDGEVDDDRITEALAEPGGVANPDKTDDDQITVDADGDKIAQLLAFLKGKLSDDDLAAATELVGAASDDPPSEGGGDMPPAMDAAAIEQRVTRRLQLLAKAKEDVLPHVGKITDTLAMDSAEKVYAFCLDKAGISTKGVPPAAFGAMVAMLPAPGGVAPRPQIAQDAADARAEFNKKFPNAKPLLIS